MSDQRAICRMIQDRTRHGDPPLRFSPPSPPPDDDSANGDGGGDGDGDSHGDVFQQRAYCFRSRSVSVNIYWVTELWGY